VASSKIERSGVNTGAKASTAGKCALGGGWRRGGMQRPKRRWRMPRKSAAKASWRNGGVSNQCNMSMNIEEMYIESIWRRKVMKAKMKCQQ
jgi:hypothetical protein